MSDSLSEDGINQEEEEDEGVMTPAELISKLEEVRHINLLSVTTPCCKYFYSCVGVCLVGLAEWEILTGAAGEQVTGGGVCDGAADSHGEYLQFITLQRIARDFLFKCFIRWHSYQF